MIPRSSAIDFGDDAGFSLTELTIALALMVVIIAAAYMAMTSVSAMTDRILAQEQATTNATNAVERMSSEIRGAWSPPSDIRNTLRSRTATGCSFYIDVGLNGTYQLVTFYVSADATGGTYSIYRSSASTTTAVPYSSVTSATAFTIDSAPKVIGIGLTQPNVFSYFQQAAGLPAATAALPPSSVQMTVVTKAKIGDAVAVATDTVLTQIRTLYNYTSQ